MVQTCWTVLLLVCASAQLLWCDEADKWKDLNLHPDQAALISTLPEFHIGAPAVTDPEGRHVTYDVINLHHQHHHHHINKRDTQTQTTTLHLSVPVKNTEPPVRLQLSPSHDSLMSRDLVIETRYGPALKDATYRRVSDLERCHYRGHAVGDDTSQAALSTCGGLTGFMTTPSGHYIIEPLRGVNQTAEVEQPDVEPPRGNATQGHQGHQLHLIYPWYGGRHDPADTWHDAEMMGDDLLYSNTTCGLESSTYDAAMLERHAWEASKQAHGTSTTATNRRRHRRSLADDDVTSAASPPGGSHAHRRYKRSYSIERYLTTTVVVDPSMMHFYRNEHIEIYIMTVMNMVSVLFHDASIGNAINVQMVKILLLEDDQEGLQISHHATETLNSFCVWQDRINPREDHPNHHDVAILITRHNLCHKANQPCSTLGLSKVAGLCVRHNSCNINEDTGLTVAYTIAHELGHNFGMKHDTPSNGCVDSKGHDVTRPTSVSIMLPEMTYGHLIWSQCSRNQITNFLDRGWGDCLNDEPRYHSHNFTHKMPGIIYDAKHQCVLMKGPGSQVCPGISNICNRLWCRVDNQCLSGHDAAAEGTLCDKDKWCIEGECVPINEKPAAIAGEWGRWSEWSSCSRTCGGGSSSKQRHCDNPPPSHGGSYCVGERRRYRMCNTDACPNTTFSSFRQKQCQQFNLLPIKGVFFEWSSRFNPEEPCVLYCYTKIGKKSHVQWATGADGTECRQGYNDRCIDGRCRRVGCDWGIDSTAREDRCGVCHGDGTTCTTVEQNFKDDSHQGYVETTVIPKGARNIYVAETSQAPQNYLAIRDNQGHFLLNGNWSIQQSGSYELAGTVLRYSRGHEHNQTEHFQAVGPLQEPLHLMLLCQADNSSVTLRYTMQNSNVTQWREPEFNWQYTDWTHCTPSCGGGQQRSEVICVETEAGHVEDRYCNITSKPDDKIRDCNMHICPAKWWTGPWQRCSRSCIGDDGDVGIRKRTVLCVRNQGYNEQIALEDHQCADAKPSCVTPCRHRKTCPLVKPYWITGQWSQTCKGDPCDKQTRDVRCSEYNALCNHRSRPPRERQCRADVVCGIWTTGVWSQCSVSCGGGTRSRAVVCAGGTTCHARRTPNTTEPCNTYRCTTPEREAPPPDTGVRFGPQLYNQRAVDNIKSPNTRVVHTRITSKFPGSMGGGRYFYGSRGRDAAAEGSDDVTANDNSSSVHEGEHGSDRGRLDGLDYTVVETAHDWGVGTWSQCSVSCGTGLQHRMVQCPRGRTCEEQNKPSSTRPCDAVGTGEGCNVLWRVGEWSKCTQDCGGGEQVRLVQCMNTQTRHLSTECDATTRPVELQTCNTHICDQQQQGINTDLTCKQDPGSFRLCKTLSRAGQCDKPFIRVKCCHACADKHTASAHVIT